MVLYLPAQTKIGQVYIDCNNMGRFKTIYIFRFIAMLGFIECWNNKLTDVKYLLTSPELCDCRSGCKRRDENVYNMTNGDAHVSEEDQNKTVVEQFQNFYNQEMHCESVRGSIQYQMIGTQGNAISALECKTYHPRDIYGLMPMYYALYETYFRNLYCFFGQRYHRDINISLIVYWHIHIKTECFLEKFQQVKQRQYQHLLELILEDSDNCQLAFLPPLEYASKLNVCIGSKKNEHRCKGSILDMCKKFTKLSTGYKEKVTNYESVCRVCSWISNDTSICNTHGSYVVLHEPRQYDRMGVSAAMLRCLRLVSIHNVIVPRTVICNTKDTEPVCFETRSPMSVLLINVRFVS